MTIDPLDLFIGRQEAITLFKSFYRYNPQQDHLPLPILSFIGEQGSGKSQLIRYLRNHYCDAEQLPYVRIDFTRPDIPKDFLSILLRIHEKLRGLKDVRGRRLSFPRFSFAAAIARAALTESNAEDLTPDQLRQRLNDRILPFLNKLEDALDNTQLQLIVKALKWATDIPAISDTIHKMTSLSGWEWYQGRISGVSANADFNEVFHGLYKMSTYGTVERKLLVEHLLPKALLADLYDSFYGAKSPKAWDTSTNIILFLDGFEELLADGETNKMGLRLLEAITLSLYRESRSIVPLLIVLTSEQQLPIPNLVDYTTDLAKDPLNPQSVQSSVNTIRLKWKDTLQRTTPNNLRLEFLLLSTALRNFTEGEIHYYLLQSIPQELVDDKLVKQVYDSSEGLPQFVALIVDDIQYRLEHGEHINVTPLTTKTIDKQLVKSFMQRFPNLAGHDATDAATRIAAPRVLDAEILQLLLQSALIPQLASSGERPLGDRALRDLWMQYSQMPFVRHLKNGEKMALYPAVREALLKNLLPSEKSSSEYTSLHKLLRTHFHAQAANALARVNVLTAVPQGQTSQSGQLSENKQAQIEEVYHALALGDYQLAVDVGHFALSNDLTMWHPLLEAVGQAPTGLMPPDIKQQAQLSLKEAKQHYSLEKVVKAIVQIRWSLQAQDISYNTVARWMELHDAFILLKHGDYQDNQDMANTYRATADALFKRIQQGPPSRQVQSLPIGLGTQGKRKKRVPRRQIAISVFITFCLALVFLNIAPLVFASLFPSTIPPAVQIQQAPLPTVNAQGVGVFSIPNGDYFGISDGSIPFDINRPDGELKQQASQAYRQGNLKRAESLWTQATAMDSNDPEPLIDLENLRVLRTDHNAYDCYIVATSLTDESNITTVNSESVTQGRDDLQGAYVAQKDFNAQNRRGVCLWIANISIDPALAGKVILQMVTAATAPGSHVKGIMGWPTISDPTSSVRDAINQLSQHNIPIVSPANYDDSVIFPNLYHIVPSAETEGVADAIYAEHLHKTRVALFIGLNASNQLAANSEALAQGFQQRFIHDGNSVVDQETYTIGTSAQAPNFESQLQHAAQFSPDLLYFTGSAEDCRTFLATLSSATIPIEASVRVLGTSALYQLVGYPNGTRIGFTRLNFSSFAYPDMPTAIGFVGKYKAAFNQGTQPSPDGAYGFTRPDGDAILAYDATQVLLEADQIASTVSPSFTGADIMRELAVTNNLSGASGTITLGTNRQPIDKAILSLSVDAESHIHEDASITVKQ